MLLHRFDVAGRLGMIPARNDESSLGHNLGYDLESLEHQFESFVGSPFSKSQNSVIRGAATRKIGKLWTTCQDPMSTHMDVVPSVLVIQDLPIGGHQDGNGVREQKHARRDRARDAIRALVSHSNVFQVHGVH